MIKTKFTFLVIAAFICVAFSFDANAQRKPLKAKLGTICGNPQVKCRTGDLTFQAHEIPFEIPRNSNPVIVESEPFYMIVLKTVKINSKVNCGNAISENERLEIQKLFPDHKVFALKCSDAGDLYYTNIADNVNFIAVFAGKTLTEAKNFLQIVQATQKFKGANIRRTQAQINGT
ncbi:MAG: hypothetical protein ACR2HG_01640 [Pyrinomonadaceae bacterium]